MTKTFAEMTPEERAECVGMWCYLFDQPGEPPVGEGIIAGSSETDDGRTLVIIDHPHPDAGKWSYELDEVRPRFELPRAWNPDGTPPAGQWQHAMQQEQVTPGSIWDLTTKETATHRRWIGGWEEAQADQE